MKREPRKPDSKSSRVSAAQARQLFVERLEMRSVLAAMFGLSETTTLLVAAPTGDADLNDPVSLPPVSEFKSIGFSSVKGGMLPFKQDAFPISSQTLPLVSLSKAEAANLTATESDLSIWQMDNAVAGEKWADMQISKGWLSIDRQAGWQVRSIELREWDFPVKGLPWTSVDPSADMSNGDVVPDNSTTESSTPPVNSPPVEIPSQPLGWSEVNDLRNESPRLFSWLESDDFEKIEGGESVSSHSSSTSVEATLHTATSVLTSGLIHHTPAKSDLDEDPDANEAHTKSELANDLLELPQSRVLQMGAEGWVRSQRNASPSRAPETLHYNLAYAADPRSEIASADAFPGDISDDLTSVFDEGGLVELFATEALRNNSAGGQPRSPSSSRIDSIDAEVGIFQAIDVASSIVDDPSQAAMSTIAFVFVFQLFDRRRKVAEQDALDSFWKGTT
jgi:hypothetical protein